LEGKKAKRIAPKRVRVECLQNRPENALFATEKGETPGRPSSFLKTTHPRAFANPKTFVAVITHQRVMFSG
jgi:hypothetical protein